MIKKIASRTWTDKDQKPAIEELYECEYGVIYSEPEYHGGGWDGIQRDCYAEALKKYKEVLKEHNRLLEAQEKR